MRELRRICAGARVILVMAALASVIAAQDAAKSGASAGPQESPKAADSAPAQKSTEPFNFPDFTAIQKIAGGGGSRSLVMKVYSSGSTVRVDLSPAMSNLFLTSTGKVYRLSTYPDKSKSCVVMRRDQERFMASPMEMLQGVKVERTPAGSDVVDGHNTKVEDVVVTRADGHVMRSKVWEADDFSGLPVKIVSEITPDANKPPLKIAALYGDFKFEKVDPALLTPPEKCTPLEKQGQVVEHEIIK